MKKRRIVSAAIGPLLVMSVLLPMSALAQTKRILPEAEATAFKCGLLTVVTPAARKRGAKRSQVECRRASPPKRCP